SRMYRVPGGSLWGTSKRKAVFVLSSKVRFSSHSSRGRRAIFASDQRKRCSSSLPTGHDARNHLAIRESGNIESGSNKSESVRENACPSRKDRTGEGDAGVPRTRPNTHGLMSSWLGNFKSEEWKANPGRAGNARSYQPALPVSSTEGIDGQESLPPIF